MGPLSTTSTALALVSAGCAVLAGCKLAPARGDDASPGSGAGVEPATPSSAAGLRPGSGCPPEMARVGAACIDRWEAHLVGLRDGRALSPYARPAGDFAAASRPGVVPQGYVSRVEAALACERAGKRLCRAAEWYAACSAAGSKLLPRGSAAASGPCNTGKPHLLPKVFGAETPFTYDAHFNSPRLNQVPGFLARTGEHAGCVSPEGVFDLVGNLHEWIADDVGPKLRDRFPMDFGAHLMGARGNGAFTGGYFSSREEHGRGCRYITTHHAPEYHDYSTGFRCCADPRAR